MTNPAVDIAQPAKKAVETHTLEIARLQAALSEAIRLKNEALQGKDCRAASPAPCHFLDNIPMEIRNHIYSFLLVNPLISKPSSINRDSIHGETVKLGLCSAILRVNRQIYNEASSILYGSNTFRVECLHRQSNPMSVITRQIDDAGHHESYKPIQSAPVVAKVKHWRVIVTAYKGCVYEAPSSDFVAFCRAICTSKPLSLTVLVIPEGMEKQDPNSFTYEPDTDNYHFLRDACNCLNLVRGVGNFKLLDATNEDLPSPPQITATHANPPAWRRRTPMQGRRKVLVLVEYPNFKLTVEGNAPVEYAFKMQKNLVVYAQAFERHAPFKMSMDVPYGVARHSLADRLGWGLGGPWGGSSPYRTPPEFHPVEDNLERAAKAADSNNVRHFKKYRHLALAYLERDYRNIVAASRDLNNFVKYQKTSCGVFDVKPDNTCRCDRLASEIDDCTQGLILLEKYVQSFRRSVTPFVALQIRKNKRKFKLYYLSLPREQLLGQLSLIHEREASRQDPNFGTFVSLFRECVDDCDKQYLEIRSARKALFDHDPPQANFHQFTEGWLCDEMVNWEVNEPQMDVPMKPLSQSVEADPNGPPPGFEAYFQNMVGGGGPPNGGFGLAFGPIQFPVPINGNAGPPLLPVAVPHMNEAINALTAIFGPPVQTPPANVQGVGPPANPLPAAAQPGQPQIGNWVNTPPPAGYPTGHAPGHAATMSAGLGAGQWFDNSPDWTSASGDSEEDEDSEDEDDEDENKDEDEEENSEYDSGENAQSDEEMLDLVGSQD